MICSRGRSTNGYSVTDPVSHSWWATAVPFLPRAAELRETGITEQRFNKTRAFPKIISVCEWRKNRLRKRVRNNLHPQLVTSQFVLMCRLKNLRALHIQMEKKSKFNFWVGSDVNKTKLSQLKPKHPHKYPKPSLARPHAPHSAAGSRRGLGKALAPKERHFCPETAGGRRYSGH